MSRDLLRECISLILHEVDISQAVDVCASGNASSHELHTCRLRGGDFYLKFSPSPGPFSAHDPRLQTLVEFLAYRIYGLYKDVHLPSEVHVVYDGKGGRVGLATGAVEGDAYDWDPAEAGKMASSGAFVDVLLANWDAMTHGNVIKSPDRLTRIDPGGAMTFRAQGSRKGGAWNDEASELDTMLRSGSGAYRVLKHIDAMKAAQSFLSVPWQRVAEELRTVDRELMHGMRGAEMASLARDWKKEVREIASVLQKRWRVVASNAEFVLAGR